ncbi:DNA mismatch repair protein MutS [Lutibacter sp. B2]|nr:DNA mismatch repair protein MutS [Lutibacter sp. B2]
MKNLTPMMRQYLELKDKYKDCILFFRLGDFYEMFFDDAIVASRELEITLTGKSCGMEERAAMCGIPFHSADSYISKLVDRGYKIAIAEQIEDPALAKGLVKRDVVKIVTPGTVLDAKMLNEKENNYIMSIYIHELGVGIAYADISTGELKTTEFKNRNWKNQLLDELAKITPREIIINCLSYNEVNIELEIQKFINVYISQFDKWAYEYDYAEKKILNHLNMISIEGLGLNERKYSICATGALFEYINHTQKNSLAHIQDIHYYSLDSYMVLDKFTRRNLELTETMRDKKKKGSLLWVLDKTNTAMGARKIKKWVEQPLKDITEIQLRVDAVEELKDNLLVREDLKEYLNSVYDLERLVVRVSCGNANARDLLALKNSLEVLPSIKTSLGELNTHKLKNIFSEMETVKEVKDIIENSIMEDPPIGVKEGGVIKDGYNTALDEMRMIVRNGKQWISDMENKEKQNTGIKSLKIGFNKVFGYYLEVTRSNLNLVPDSYIRKQTLSNAERYITPELKEVESKILGAEDKIFDLEYEIFTGIREEIKKYTNEIQKTAFAVASLDVLLSFAEISDQYGYCKPLIDDEGTINIVSGRHPVVERMMDQGMFIGNDTLLDDTDHRFSIITGPNMAGKSTYMRQVALIALMSQIGCFVPADSATIGMTDRIFTRVGASDDLSQGQSTFMVEMSELANILNNATNKSLIILDEIGRGTSTYDGLSIAWSVVEYISSQTSLGARTLFATHYHELTELEETVKGVKNYSIDVKENNDDIVFLHKIIRGSANQSYGIEVAKLAGVKGLVIHRAKEILAQLENNEKKSENKVEKEIAICEEQIDFLAKVEENNKESEIIAEIQKVNILEMTPMDAMNCLYNLVKIISN